MSNTGRGRTTSSVGPEFPNLKGEVAVVIGAGGGIGMVIAERLSHAGASVLFQHRGRHNSADAAASSLRSNGLIAWAVASDFASLEDAAELFSTCRAELGIPTVVVNAAGSYISSTLADMTLDSWRQSVSDNLETSFLAVKAAESAMSNGGSVILVGSISAHIPAAKQAAYNSAKAGAMMLMRSAAQELGPRGIRVNAISPGLIYRQGLEQQWPEGVSSWNAKVPLRRLGQPEDVADACLFLASRASSWITGHDLIVDGGMMTGPLY